VPKSLKLIRIYSQEGGPIVGNDITRKDRVTSKNARKENRGSYRKFLGDTRDALKGKLGKKG